MTTDGVLTRQDVEVIKHSAECHLLWLAVLVVALLVTVVASVIFGIRAVSLDDASAALSGGTAATEQAAAAGRLPRMVLGLLSGVSLAIAGGAMQVVTHNPLADPGIFGMLSGASLAAVIGLAFFDLSHPYAQLLIVVLGAGVAAGFVYDVGSLRRGGAIPLKSALAGTATSAACSSLVSAILLPRVWAMDSFRFWQIDGINGTTWDRTGLMAPFLMAGALICLFSACGMDSLTLGDDIATGLGENMMRTRLVTPVDTVTLHGVATAICGPIAFVGLIVPHLCRFLVGIDHRWMLPFADLTSTCPSLAADTLRRVVTPNSEINVGVITPFLGAPFFIWIARRQEVREL